MHQEKNDLIFSFQFMFVKMEILALMKNLKTQLKFIQLQTEKRCLGDGAKKNLTMKNIM